MTDRADLLRGRPTLEALLRYPGRLAEVTPEALPALAAEVAGLLGRLASLALSVSARLAMGTDARESGGDRLITVQEAAERLSRAPTWFYRRRNRDLPFIVRDGRMVRVSEKRLAAWIRSRTGAPGG